MAQEKQIGFRLYFPMRKMLLVRSDIGLIKSILMNLVSNAVKFTTTGSILISARQRGKDALFQVWDSGMGISKEHIKHIFGEFYQVNNPQRDRTSGLGLGLSIAKRALTLLGEDITCRSKLGRGSVFEFHLPLDNALPAPLPQIADLTVPEDVANESFAQGKRFVVVEDDALVAQAMINWLEGMGGEVKCFHSAEDALRHSNLDHADYYIADYMLGGTLNGIEFLNMVRLKLGKPIRAVLVTGDTSATFIRHAVECDWPVLHKPINTSKLISALITQTPEN
jgi:ActR/RegA family two-component response regulator